MTQVRIIEIQNLEKVKEEMRKIGVDKEGIEIMAGKAMSPVLKIENIKNQAANILKQEMLGLGGEAAVSYEVCAFKPGLSSVLLFGTLKHYQQLLEKLTWQPYELPEIRKKIGEVLEIYLKNSRPKKIQIMGVLNVTPDSFFNGNKYFDLKKAVTHAEEMAMQGAEIIDLGGESTRPGAEALPLEEELKRTIPVIKELRKKIKIAISIDTYKSEVARQALDCGAKMVNDISGLRFDEQMVEIVGKYQAPVIIMHMQGTPRNMQENPEYNDVVKEIYTFFEERINFCLNAGIKKENILLDPGIGFGKTVEHNLEILRRLNEFHSLGYPLVLGTSRKSFIGKILDPSGKGLPPEERLEGSIASYVWAVIKGADILRVHDVKEAKRAVKVVEAIMSR